MAVLILPNLLHTIGGFIVIYLLSQLPSFKFLLNIAYQGSILIVL